MLCFIDNITGVYRQIDKNAFLSEARRKKKKKKTDEMSMTGNVAGFTGPMAGPANRSKFYPSMAKAAGGEYLIDPVKNLKAKP